MRTAWEVSTSLPCLSSSICITSGKGEADHQDGVSEGEEVEPCFLSRGKEGGQRSRQLLPSEVVFVCASVAKAACCLVPSLMHPLVNGRCRRTLSPVSQSPTPRPVSANVSFSAISHETTLQHWFPASQPHAGLKVKTGQLHHCQTVSVYSDNLWSLGQLFHPAQPGNSEMDSDCCCSGLLILMAWLSTRILGIASRRTTSHRSRGISITIR